ncbi:MAG: hypothetical protein HY575_08930 [candidate division NC10 bacterium]|nr:hypothetical protein [candidate division NC10 bacterium]
MQRSAVPFLVAAVSLLGLYAAAEATGLSAAPRGYSWKRLEEVRATFLIPDGWHFKHEQKGNTLAYFITQENIASQGRFETGLTLNVIRGLGAGRAHETARQFIASLASQNEPLQTWETGTGVLKGYGCEVRVRASGHRPAIVIHGLAIANTRTDTLYLVLFEGPEASWQLAWEKGRVILEAFALDDEI